MNNPLYEQKKEEYHQKRTASEFDLVEYVKNQLNMNGLAQNAEYFMGVMAKLDIIDKKPEVQRYHLNKFFFTQLMAVGEPSFEERFCLVPDGRPEDWANLFTKKIINFLVRNNLPRPL